MISNAAVSGNPTAKYNNRRSRWLIFWSWPHCRLAILAVIKL